MKPSKITGQYMKLQQVQARQNMTKPAKPSKQQNGIALIFVLLILVIVSLLGIGGAQLALMGERGARNERDTQIAKQYAEAALADAEFDIRGDFGTKKRPDVFKSEMNFEEGCGATGSNTQGLCAQSLSGKPIWLTVDFMAKDGVVRYVTLGDFTGRKLDFINNKGLQPALAPRYIVEILPDKTVGNEIGIDVIEDKEKKKMLYRITAMGFGPREDIRTVLQTVYRKK
jgi:type IV pilus assembly protein PilX